MIRFAVIAVFAAFALPAHAQFLEADCVADQLDAPTRAMLAASTLETVDNRKLRLELESAHETCGALYRWTDAQHGQAQDIAVYFSLAESFQTRLSGAGANVPLLLDAFGKLDRFDVAAAVNGGVSRNDLLAAKVKDAATRANADATDAGRLLETILLHAEAQNAWKRS